MTRLDCTDIKALLSGLVDGEVDEETRHWAERHLSGCPQCRRIMDEAEGLDELVQRHAASLVDPRGLPAGFEEQVLSRTVDAQRRSYFQQWTTWAGWFAAAASLGLAIFIWVADHKVTPTRTAKDNRAVPQPFVHVNYGTGVGLESQPFDGSLPVDSIPTLEESVRSRPALTREDAETLYFVSILLGQLAVADDATFEDIEMVREAIEYENLLERLPQTTTRMSSNDDKILLLAAYKVLDDAVNEPVTQATIGDLRDMVLQLDLAAKVDEISRSEDHFSI